MRKVIGIGETVLDIIFKDNKPIGAVPGGSTLNAIVSLGKAGVDASFIGETGNDRIGASIVGFLNDNHVGTQGVCRYPESKSAVSLAFLDDNNDAQYIFYKDHPHDQLDFASPDIAPDDIVLLGSYYAVNPVIRPQVAGLLEQARAKGAIVYYDVNYRSSHKDDVMKITPNLIENLEYADIVRGSREDFLTLYGIDDPERIYNAEISFYCKQFIFTDGARPVTLMAGGKLTKQYPVPATHTVSTIGAGDNFNAGFIYGLIKHNVGRDELLGGMTEQRWDMVVTEAQLFAADCCKDIQNNISDAFAEQKRIQ